MAGVLKRTLILFNGRYFLGIESDPNYSSAAILMITLFLFQLKIKMRHVIVINSIFFVLLFSRTAIFAMLITILKTLKI